MSAPTESVSELLVTRLIDSDSDLEQALTLERKVFEECNFVSMDEYESFLGQSIFFGTFDAFGQCHGMVRLIQGAPQLTPVLAHGVRISDDPEKWISKAKENRFWEFATMAVRRTARSRPIFMMLIASAFEYALRHGAEYFGAIMEPSRARGQNKAFQLLFQQVGPEQSYMGELVETAPFVLDLRLQHEHLSVSNPAYLRWLLDRDSRSPLFRPPTTRPETVLPVEPITSVVQPHVVDLRETAAG